MKNCVTCILTDNEGKSKGAKKGKQMKRNIDGAITQSIIRTWAEWAAAQGKTQNEIDRTLYEIAGEQPRTSLAAEFDIFCGGFSKGMAAAWKLMGDMDNEKAKD